MDYGAMMESCGAYIATIKPKLREPEVAAAFVRPILEAATNGNSQEGIMVILLDTKRRVISAPALTAMGTLDSSPVHPREVFRAAVQASAAAVILAHNHPSGDPTPSPEDLLVTGRLVEAGKILGIPVLDHLIIGRATGDSSGVGYVSLREKNLVAFE